MRDTRELIDELARDAAPVPRLRRPRDLALAWLAGSWLFVVVATLLRAPLRPGVGEQLLASPRFLAESALGVVAGVLAVWVAAYGVGLVAPPLEPSMLGKRPGCWLEVLAYGVPTLLAGLLLLRRLAPLARPLAGVAVGAAAGAVPALLMQLACMYVPEHVLTHHVAPIAALAALGAGLGPLLLRRI